MREQSSKIRFLFNAILFLAIVAGLAMPSLGARAIGVVPFDNPDYYYTNLTNAPDGTFYRQAAVSPDGTKILAQKSWNDGSARTEIVLMNTDGSGEIIISTNDSGSGDIYGYMNPFWSDDGTAIGFAEVHNTTANKIMRYDLGGSSSYIYEPESGKDANNADFLGGSKNAIVFWDIISGEADLFTWDGSILTNITNTTGYKEYEPVSNSDGTKIVYWSGETTAEPVNTTHTLTDVAGTWTLDVGFTPIVDTYWSAWTTPAATQIGVTVMSSKDILIYDNTGALVTDLTGPGYSGGAGKWNFFGTMSEGPYGEFVVTSNAWRGATAGRDIIVAAPRSTMYVDDSGSDSNPGTEAAPFATIQKAVAEVADGGTVYVAAGTYTEQVTVNKSIGLFGDGAGSSIIAAPATLPASSNQTSAIVRFDGAGVTSEFTGFTVTGPGPAACGSIAAGILVSGGANAYIHDNTVADVRDSTFSGCQNGIAIQVGRNAWTTTGTATIENNIVTGYQKGGIVVDNAGSSATITGNTVTGAGTTDVTAQNGIQISRGANATLTGNTVSGNSFHLDGNAWDWGAAGVLLYQAGDVSLAGGNSIHDNDQNLYVDSATAFTAGTESIGPSTAPLYYGYEVINLTALNFDLTGVTFSEATNCQIEERTWHGVDDTTYGPVYWMAGNLYVAPPES
ncbi:MAG: right-handed parallel beta-helix repeat-containing protein, partial [Chloroflexota bacterium]